jgi:two-component system response regulator MprA
MPYQVAVVEDDSRMRATIVRGLQAEGLRVPIDASTGHAFLTSVARSRVDVVVLDIGLPDCDGRDVCLALRARGMDVPVLLLTAREAVADRLLGFHAGADDYLPKPFSFSELVVRVTALGRRHARSRDPDGGVVLDPVTHALRAPGGSMPLTPTEFRVLSVLLSRRGEVLRRRSISAAAWPDGCIVHENTLDAYVGRVRRKLRAVEAEVALTTVRGVGYRVD